MGCTPSIHVSQTGVIYCQDSDESPSSANHQLCGIHGRFRSEGTSDSPSGNTQQSVSSVLGSATPPAPGRADPKKWCPPQKENNEIKFGSFRLTYDPLKVLLVFGKEDAQSDALWWAAEKLQYQCSLAKTADAALDLYMEKFHELVFIDARHSKYMDPESVCRTFRSVKGSQHTFIVAVVKKGLADKEEATIMPLLNSGFNKWYIESASFGICLNELIQIEVNEVRSRLQLRAAQALFAALDNCRDLIEITNDRNEIQYVNRTCEKHLGYSYNDMIGRPIQEVHKLDTMKAEFLETIQNQMNKGKNWEGTYLSRRKSGESIPMPCKVIPVICHGTTPSHHVYVKELPMSWERSLFGDIPNGKDSTHISALDLYPYHRTSLKSFRKGSYDVKSLNSEVSLVSGAVNRRQSMAKIHAMTIEAPITKVINLISAAQENSPMYIAQALDKVLEILRSTELYSPQLLNHQGRNDDPIALDLLGGLLSQGPKISLGTRRQSEVTFNKGPNYPSGLKFPNLSSVPSNIKNLLENESQWNFDVIALEKATNKRPLVWLGMAIFSRFGVASILNCDEVTIQNWLTLIEANYHANNPYHNSTHAADVLQGAAYFLGKERFKQLFHEMDDAACLIAAVVHDVDHPGKNSAFLCNSNNELAILYNDLSVLESHHSALAFKLTTSDERVNIFRNLDTESYRAIRQSIIEMVLATEMTKHFEHLSKFVNVFNKASIKDDESVASESACDIIDMNALSTPENIMLIKRMLIKCADVSNPTRTRDLCIEWAYRIAEEYCQQTEEEKSRNLPVVMPMFDKATCSIPKSQMSFVDYFITDMFEAWDAFADLPELIDNLHINYQYWKDQEQIESGRAEEQKEEETSSVEPST